MRETDEAAGALRAELAPWDQLPDLGLYMDQVITYLERMFAPMRPHAAEKLITSAMINNYVKAGLVPRPAGKKYERAHLAALVMVTTLKASMRMDAIARLLRAPSAPEDPRALRGVRAGACGGAAHRGRAAACGRRRGRRAAPGACGVCVLHALRGAAGAGLHGKKTNFRKMNLQTDRLCDKINMKSAERLQA